MPRQTFQEFMALMQQEGADKSIRAIAMSWRVESPDHFFAVVMESLYKAWSADPSHVGNVRAWAKRAAINAAKRERQAAARQQEVLVRYDTHEELDTLLTSGGSASLAQSSPQTRLEAMEELEFIARQLEHLCPSERVALRNLLERLCGDRPDEQLPDAERKALKRARTSLENAIVRFHDATQIPVPVPATAASSREALSPTRIYVSHVFELQRETEEIFLVLLGDFP